MTKSASAEYQTWPTSESVLNEVLLYNAQRNRRRYVKKTQEKKAACDTVYWKNGKGLGTTLKQEKRFEQRYDALRTL